jgi:ABC-type Fe3+ transport system substrate-binding protein
VLVACAGPSPSASSPSTGAAGNQAAVATSAPQGAAAATPASSNATAAQASATHFGPKFQALLDEAKKGDGHLRAGMDAYSPEFIRAMESQFEQEFGIKITLENEPGHGSREIPPKMMQAQAVGKGLVDWIDGGNPSNFAPLMQKDALQVPDWEALTEQWPEIADLRKMYPDVPGGPNGTTLQDYCMLNTQSTWIFVYNTRNVKPEEVQNLKWNDLLSDKWQGRVAWDAQALGFKELPFSPAWPQDRLKAFTNNLGVNKVKLISGGTTGVLQAVIQGEGDIGMAEAGNIVDQISQGAPLGIAWPDVIPFNSLGTCVPKITLDNRALAEVFFAWRNIDGEWLRAKMGAGGARPYYAPEADKFSLAKLAKDAGVTPDRLAQPKTPADFDQVEQNRQVAINGMKAGLQTGQKLPYTW